MYSMCAYVCKYLYKYYTVLRLLHCMNVVVVGPAAILAKNCIKKVEVLEYPELGMEAVWKIDVENFPAFIVVDDKGNDFYSKWIP